MTPGENAMSKILIITNLYPNSEEPERGVYVAQLCRELTKYCGVTIVSPLPWFPRWRIFCRFKEWHKYSKVPNKEIRDDIVIYYPKYFMIPKVLIFLHSVFMFISVYPFIKKLHQRNRYDLVHGKWMFPDGVVSAWIANRLKIPAVLSAHGCDINRDARTLSIRWQIRVALKSAKQVIAVSYPLKKAVEDLQVEGVRVRAIVNGVDTKRFRLRDRGECRRRLELVPEVKLILFVGELVDVKGIPTLIEAVKKMSSQKFFQVVILGAGASKKMYESKVVQRNLDRIVRFLGPRDHDEVALWMNAADVLCLPSLREGTPNVVLEALASGCPVVASAVGEIPNLITKDNGLLTQVGDADALAAALSCALEKRWDARLIRESVEGRTWAVAAEEYWSEFQKVMNLRIKTAAL